MKIYSYNITNADETQLKKWFEQMSSEKKQSVSQMKVENKKNLRIAADALCRNALSDFCGIPPAEIIFEYSARGKPHAKGLPVHFSISHSGDIAVCAVCDKEIGIDIERIRSFNPKAAEKFATENESEYIRNTQNGFFEIWTLKESYFKCIGTGLGADIKKVSFEIDSDNIICSEHGFELSFIDINKNYICSVCKKTALD